MKNPWGNYLKSFINLRTGLDPSGELMDLFLDIISEEGDLEDETN